MRSYLAATVNAAAVAKHHGVKAFINYVADDALTDENYRNHPEPAAQAALAGRAELVRSSSRARTADSASRRLLFDFHFGVLGQQSTGVLPWAIDPDLAERLWHLSEKMTGVAFSG